LADRSAFKAWLEPLYDTNWHVYTKPPFAGPEAVLGRYTHRVAISNSRLIRANDKAITFRYKDYRLEGPDRYKTMTLTPGSFVDSCCTSCPKAFTASAIMGCSPEVPPKQQHLLGPES
jgi:hypothetical protein